MAFFDAVALAAFHLEDDQLRAAEMLLHFEGDGGAWNGRRAEVDGFAVLNHKDAVSESDGLARFGINPVDFENGAGFDFELFAAGFDNGVHDDEMLPWSSHDIADRPKDVRRTVGTVLTEYEASNVIPQTVSAKSEEAKTRRKGRKSAISARKGAR